MQLPNISLSAVSIILLGLFFLIGGAYFAVFGRMRLMGIGMLFIALGCFCCGLTDGFTDISPRGRWLRRFGYASFLIGIPTAGYPAYYYL